MPRRVSVFDTDTTDPNLDRSDFSSPEWLNDARQRKATLLDERTESRQIQIDLKQDREFYIKEIQRLQDLSISDNQIQARDIRLAELQDELATINSKILPDRQTTPTILIDRVPTPEKKAVSRKKLTQEEVAQQEEDEDYVNVTRELEKAETDLKKINVKIKAQDARTIAGREKIAELQAAREAAIEYIKRHEVQSEEVIIERNPAPSAKKTKPVYTTSELAEQEVNEDYVATTTVIEDAREQLTFLDTRLRAQDSRTIAGQRNIAELNRQRQAIETSIAEHLPTPPDIRPEIVTRLDRLEKIRFKSRDLHNKSNAFKGDKAAADAAAEEMIPLNQQIEAEYIPLYNAAKEAYNQLIDIQRQELPLLPTKSKKGMQALNNWFTTWKDSTAGSGQETKKQLPFYKRMFAKPNEIALGELKKIANSQQLKDAVDNTVRLERTLKTWEKEVEEQEEYVVDFSEQVNDVIKNGLPELPNKITNDERAVWLPLLDEIANTIKGSAIPAQVNRETLKKWDAFYKAVGKQIDFLNKEIITKTAKADTSTVDVEDDDEDEKRREKDTSITIDWASKNSQAKLQRYVDSHAKGTAEKHIGQLLQYNKGAINKNYFLNQAKRFHDTGDLEEIWDSFAEAMSE